MDKDQEVEVEVAGTDAMGGLDEEKTTEMSQCSDVIDGDERLYQEMIANTNLLKHKMGL